MKISPQYVVFSYVDGEPLYFGGTSDLGGSLWVAIGQAARFRLKSEANRVARRYAQSVVHRITVFGSVPASEGF